MKGVAYLRQKKRGGPLTLLRAAALD